MRCRSPTPSPVAPCKDYLSRPQPEESALLGERRFDVAPITPADVTPKKDVDKRIGIRTHRVEMATRAAKATLEIGRLPDLGDSGALLCRMLLDLMNAPPGTWRG